MPNTKKLKELMALAQVGQAMNAPQERQQELASHEQQGRVASAMHMLGLMQQQQGAQAQLEQQGQQFQQTNQLNQQQLQELQHFHSGELAHGDAALRQSGEQNAALREFEKQKLAQEQADRNAAMANTAADRALDYTGRQANADRELAAHKYATDMGVLPHMQGMWSEPMVTEVLSRMNPEVFGGANAKIGGQQKQQAIDNYLRQTGAITDPKMKAMYPVPPGYAPPQEQAPTTTQVPQGQPNQNPFALQGAPALKLENPNIGWTPNYDAQGRPSGMIPQTKHPLQPILEYLAKHTRGY